MATDFVQKWGKISYPPALITLSLRNEMGYHIGDERINSYTIIALDCVKKVKIGSIVFELNRGRK